MDASHDFSHIERVQRLALRIARDEGVVSGSQSELVVSLAALLHDIADRKYGGSDTAMDVAARAIMTAAVRACVRSCAIGMSPACSAPPLPQWQV